MRALIIGIGGGGDVVSAYVAYEYYKRMGYETSLGAVIWERYVEDPLPGPICYDSLYNFQKINDSVYIVRGDTYAIRGNRKVIPQIARVLSVLKEKGYGICIRKGPYYTFIDLYEAIKKENFDLVVGVDAGGDVLAKGCEDTLRSPLTDFTMLYILAKLKEKGINSVLGVIGAGSDGELDHDYVLKRISEIASNDGLLDIKGIDKEMNKTLDKILEVANTEASRIPVEAFRGYYGMKLLRGGRKKAKVDPTTAVMFFLDPTIVASTSPLLKLFNNVKDIDELDETLRSNGIYSEYFFEKDLFRKFGLDTPNAPPEEVEKIEKEGITRVGKPKIDC
ncbi:MAG: DUF1152 domain-containing protein [Sulfolobus sp.]|nr:DUF1152 domain-containing protein [Sulfolobus sp.]